MGCCGVLWLLGVVGCWYCWVLLSVVGVGGVGGVEGVGVLVCYIASHHSPTILSATTDLRYKYTIENINKE